MANPPLKLSRINSVIAVFSVLMIGIGIFFRGWNLTKIPAGLYYDEMDNVFLGESVARFGTDITGTWSPFQLRPYNSLNLNAELPSVFHALAQKIVGFGGVVAHLPNTFFGLMTGVAVVFIVKKLTGQWQSALLAGGLLLINPWHIHVSRTAYEAGISLFFQALIILGFVWLQKAKKPLEQIACVSLALVGTFVGFFTYHGAKFTIPIVVVYMTGYLLASSKKRNFISKISLILPLLLSIILCGYYLRLNSQKLLRSRQSELIFSTQYIEKEVDSRRKLSVNFPGKELIINKATVIADEMVKRYLFVFDVRRLFSQGTEDAFQFSLYVFPYFYLTSILFLSLGIYYCLKFPDYRFLIGLALVSPITSVITLGYQSIFRAGLTYLCLIIIAGIGLSGLVGRLAKSAKWLVVVGLFVAMLIEVVLFGGNYFGRYPVVTANNHYFFERLLSGYIGHLDQKVIVISSSPFTVARSLVSYLQLMPLLSQKQKNQFGSVGAGEFDLGHIQVTSSCLKSYLPDTVVIADASKREECGLDIESTIQLASPIDSGTYYFIYNDPLCKKAEIPHYVYVTNINYFDVTHLSSDQICHNWMRQEKQ